MWLRDMAIVIFVNTSREIVRFALLFIVSTAVYSCGLKPTGKSMDISDFIENKYDLEKFINENFEDIEYQESSNPLLVFQVNRINKTESLKFCSMNVQQCWVKQIDTLYAFLFLLNDLLKLKSISPNDMVYGETRGEISIQDSCIGGDLFSWNTGQMEIDVSQFLNSFQVPRYEMRDLVVCRDMSITPLLERSDTRK